MQSSVSYTEADLPRVVADFLHQRIFPFVPPLVLALHGDLGAGKTTFVKELALQLGVVEPVTSPTFTIMKSYSTTHPIFTSLVHIDAYRLESADEARPLHLSQVMAGPGALVCIEWPTRIETLLPSRTLHLTFSVVSETERLFTLEMPSGF